MTQPTLRSTLHRVAIRSPPLPCDTVCATHPTTRVAANVEHVVPMRSILPDGGQMSFIHHMPRSMGASMRHCPSPGRLRTHVHRMTCWTLATHSRHLPPLLLRVGPIWMLLYVVTVVCVSVCSCYATRRLILVRCCMRLASRPPTGMSLCFSLLSSLLAARGMPVSHTIMHCHLSALCLVSNPRPPRSPRHALHMSPCGDTPRGGRHATALMPLVGRLRLTDRVCAVQWSSLISTC